MIISFEGIEGVGKSTQINLLKDWLNNKGLSTVLYREPGSTETSEKIRDLLLSNELNLSNESELLLMFAARATISVRYPTMYSPPNTKYLLQKPL